MRIKVNFDELQNVLSYCNTVLSDKSVDDKMRNVIFMVTKESLKVVGYNAFTFSRTEVENWSIEDEEGLTDDGWKFQIKSNELNKIMSSFSSMYKTKVEWIDFEENGVKIEVTVHEEPLDEANSKLAQDSKFQLENAPILKNVLQSITMESPENADLVTSGDLLLYLDSLFPLMSNDSANSMGSKINFAEDYVFVITSTMSAFMQNKLPDAFKELTLTYSSANFLKKLCESEESIGVSRIENYVCVLAGNTEAFMKYQKVKVNHKMYVEKRNKDLGVVVDRLYLKDVLKRMGNISSDGKMLILEDGNLQVNNENFQQLIPLNNAKEGTAGIHVNISIPILEKVIVGRDDVFTSDVFMYFVPTARGYIVYLSDETGAWFANTQVTKA